MSCRLSIPVACTYSNLPSLCAPFCRRGVSSCPTAGCCAHGAPWRSMPRYAIYVPGSSVSFSLMQAIVLAYFFPPFAMQGAMKVTQRPLSVASNWFVIATVSSVLVLCASANHILSGLRALMVLSQFPVSASPSLVLCICASICVMYLPAPLALMITSRSPCPIVFSIMSCSLPDSLVDSRMAACFDIPTT